MKHVRYAIDYGDDGLAFYTSLLELKAAVCELLSKPGAIYERGNFVLRLYKRNTKKSIACGNPEAFTAEFTLLQLYKLPTTTISRIVNRCAHWTYFDWSEYKNA